MSHEVFKRLETYLAKRMYELEQLRKLYDQYDQNAPHLQIQVMQQIRDVTIQVDTIERLYKYLRND